MNPSLFSPRTGPTRNVLHTLLTALTALIALTGCSTVTNPKEEDELGYTPDVREISQAKTEARGISSELYDIIGLQGKVTGTGPGVALCDGKDYGKYYVIHHPWGLTDLPIEELRKGMDRLKKGMPNSGWKIVKYGPDTSPSKSLEIIADSTKAKFSVNIRLFDESKRTEPDAPKSMIVVDLVSACFQVPKGKRVDEY